MGEWFLFSLTDVARRAMLDFIDQATIWSSVERCRQWAYELDDCRRRIEELGPLVLRN